MHASQQPSPGKPGSEIEPVQVICLCAAWCGVCRDWTPVFEALASAYPHVQFDWVDVEDEADAMGDVDIETFPSLLVAQGDSARFFGPVQPSFTQVSRLVESLLSERSAQASEAAQAGDLLQRLRSVLLPKR
jgi:thioredoxin 1